MNASNKLVRSFFSHRGYMADGIGLAVLAALITITAFTVPDWELGLIGWIWVYLTWAAIALFYWHHRKAPILPTKWLLEALCTVPAAALVYGYFRLTSLIIFPQNEPQGSKTFDIALALCIAPGHTVIAFCGWVRCLFKPSVLESDSDG